MESCIEQIRQEHPLVKEIKKAFHTRRNIKSFGQDADWRGYVVCNKDVQVAYTGNLGRKIATFRKDKVEPIDFHLLWRLTLKAVQEGPPVRRGDDNPEKWWVGNPREEDPLLFSVYDNYEDIPDNRTENTPGSTPTKRGRKKKQVDIVKEQINGTD